DPTWKLDRYYNTRPANTPNRWTRDLLSLKPGHPERIVFAGILGVPLVIPTRMAAEQSTIQWDQLLGAPAAASPDDFYGRDSTTAISGTQGTAGPFSMRAANPDPLCEHVVPACRTEGSTYDPARACAGTSTSPGQSLAFPSRRIVEIARRFDETPACNGQPCRNGIVASICANDFSSAMDAVLQKIILRITPKCLPRPLVVQPNADGTESVTCVVREELPVGQTACDPARGRRDPENPADRTTTDSAGISRTVCIVDQVPTYAEGAPNALQPVSGDAGWYYDRRPVVEPGACTRQIRFSTQGEPSTGSTIRLECVQSVSVR
ncbi:MAG: hypothetical protein Q8Q09_22150, partial [Deltaproteobacteria bacterium]|nr:hypothetical protein [Deltaproteobacteria bacterium]